ncbi:MAG: ATP-dependent DNA helicase RecG [Gammaproteobacteria bacterium]|nr:ATP-dependent DNA helicase RecG [Gammaproteobacteria bacterium]
MKPVTAIKGVGPRMAQRLEKLHIWTVEDVLFHLPMRYEDRTRILPIGSLHPGEHAVVQGEVQLSEIKLGKRRTLLTRITDGTGYLTLRFFYFNSSQKDALSRGITVRFYGEVRSGATTLEMIHPEYIQVSAGAVASVEESLTPVYPATEGLHQQTLRKITGQALDMLEQTELSELLPDELLRSRQMVPLPEALHYIHRPPPDAPVAQMEVGLHPFQQRLAFEELLAQQLGLRRLRHNMERHLAPPLQSDGTLREALLAALPFHPTGAQQRVGTEIAADLAREHPMQRLVQGDVGSGKTLVAAMAALQAIEAGYQVALMAPTELLAEQHLQNFSAWLTPLGIEVAWLTGKLKGKPRQAMLESIADGSAGLVVGTHALFQDEVAFARLGLVIIDEQHRFGVHQRLALREKGGHDGRYPHQLIMTATPIPRTLAMTAYADLDVSIIDELPPGRTPVETIVIPDSRRDEVVARVGRACAEGRQAYWVCTLIDESDVLQCQAAEDTAVLLTAALPGLKVGLVHGRMKGQEKEQVMAAFKAGEIPLLVATTVIEVGVDVPNASLMIMENAERLGLAQLHQLRGRVGRGSAASSCVLMYHGPLGQIARQRLAVMRETNDGFVVAQKDLEIRGPGEVLGTRQTGLLTMRIADLQRDQAMLPEVREVADMLLDQYPDRAEALIRRWIGDQRSLYGDV